MSLQQERQEEAIRDAFISGLQSSLIRQRLLENRTLDLATMLDQARALDAAQKNSELYSASVGQSVMAAVPEPMSNAKLHFLQILRLRRQRLMASAFCGYSQHQRSKCPARDAVCNKCHKKGHYAKVCQSSSVFNSATSASVSPYSSFGDICFYSCGIGKSHNKSCHKRS